MKVVDLTTRDEKERTSIVDWLREAADFVSTLRGRFTHAAYVVVELDSEGAYHMHVGSYGRSDVVLIGAVHMLSKHLENGLEFIERK